MVRLYCSEWTELFDMTGTEDGDEEGVVENKIRTKSADGRNWSKENLEKNKR